MARPDATEACPGCGVTYGSFRTGLSFSGVQEMMWNPSEDSEQWRNRRRQGVLGYWMQLKVDMWAGHIRECADQMLQTPEEIDASIPF